MAQTFVEQLSPRMSIAFREPTMQDFKTAQAEAEKRKHLGANAPSEEEILAAMCIMAVTSPKNPADMVPLAAFGDPDELRVVNQVLTFKEHQAYRTLFYLMFTLSNDELEEIKAKAKKLLSGSSASLQKAAAIETESPQAATQA